MNAPQEDRNPVTPETSGAAAESPTPEVQSPAAAPTQADAAAQQPPLYGQPYPPPPPGGWQQPPQQRGGWFGRASSSSGDPRHKSVTLATVLSFLPGLGQIYVGNYQRGFIHALIFASLITIVSNGASGLEPLLGISIGFFWFYNVIDAGRRAAIYNQVLDAQASGQLPAEIDVPGSGGSFAGGIALMVLGLVFLLYTRFDFDMYWLEEWWPLGLIILGGYLFFKDRFGRKQSGDAKAG